MGTQELDNSPREIISFVRTSQAAGSQPKRVEWYGSDHILPEEAFHDIADQLETKIGVDASQFTDS